MNKNTSLEDLPYWSIGRTAVALPPGKYYAAADVERLLATTAGEQAEPAHALRDSFAEALHYPGCWDTAAYPALSDALAAVYAHFKCTECAQAAPAAPEQVPAIGRLLDEFSALPVLWGLNEPGALMRHSDVFKMLVNAGKTYLAATSAAAPAAPSFTDEEITEAASGIYLSDFGGKGTQAYDIAIVRAALAALAKKAPAAPAAPEQDLDAKRYQAVRILLNRNAFDYYALEGASGDEIDAWVDSSMKTTTNEGDET